MKSRTDCAQAETLAGAIALGEAGDNERLAYRGHLSTCRRCVSEIGGEREIERVMAVVAQARDLEHWQPQVRKIFARAPRRAHLLRWGAALAVAALAVLATRELPSQPPLLVHRVMPSAVSAISPAQEARVAELGTQMTNRHEHRAESLVFGTGNGTVARVTLQVGVDRQGHPTRCAVVSHAAAASRDAALCNAVMRAHLRARATAH
ncbi:MAG TPA: hypothetical protein VGX91_05050 [Candidatus Cybelea sp.]|nr:hypothetical protein [Candidatus Cybelea sp.]